MLEFGSNKSWLVVGMALHAASGGDPDVGDEFLDWSEGDPDPKYSRDMNRRRWDSFRLDKESLIGARTLLKICREHGVSEATLHTVFNDATDDFDGEYVSDSPMFEPDRDGQGLTAPSRTASPPVKLNEVSADNIDLVFKLVNMGGKARIVYMGKSSIDKSVRVPEVWAVEDLRNALRNKFVTVEYRLAPDVYLLRIGGFRVEIVTRTTKSHSMRRPPSHTRTRSTFGAVTAWMKIQVVIGAFCGTTSEKSSPAATP